MSYQVWPWVIIRRRCDGGVLYLCGNEQVAVILRAPAYKEIANARRMSLFSTCCLTNTL